MAQLLALVIRSQGGLVDLASFKGFMWLQKGSKDWMKHVQTYSLEIIALNKVAG